MGLGLDNPVHLAIVLAVVLVLFGAKRMPEIGAPLSGRGESPGPREAPHDGHPGVVVVLRRNRAEAFEVSPRGSVLLGRAPLTHLGEHLEPRMLS
jgi:hypothetical protein